VTPRPSLQIDKSAGNTSALSVGLRVIATPVRDTSALESVVAAEARQPNSGLIVCPDSFMDVHRAEVTLLAACYRLPAVYPFHQFSQVGGLVSYGNDQRDNYRRAAVYVDRILQGTKPLELPVQAPVKFDLDEARAQPGDQPQDRQGARPNHPALAAAAGG
jgi:putative ABC transport system substrate-binding protein